MPAKSPTFELIIIGTGPAGLSAGLYAGLYGLKTLVIGSILGGQLNFAPEIIDYPGMTSVKGKDWLNALFSQLAEAKIPLLEARVEELASLSDLKPPAYLVSASAKTYRAQALILAFGNQNRRPTYSGRTLAAGLGVSLDTRNLVIVDRSFSTSLPGVFAAGNCLSYPQGLEQLGLAAGQGIAAAAQAYTYLRQQPPPLLWGKTKISQPPLLLSNKQ